MEGRVEERDEDAIEVAKVGCWVVAIVVIVVIVVIAVVGVVSIRCLSVLTPTTSRLQCTHR